MISNRSQLRLFGLSTAFFLVTFAAMPFGIEAQGKLPEGIRRVTSVEGITEYRLPNGLTVLLFPDPTKQTITVNIT